MCPASVRSSLRLLVLLWLAAVAGCSSSEPSAAMSPSADDVHVDAVEVVRGVPSRGRDPAVVAIDINGEGLCTGALVAPAVVLTARHCVSKTSEAIACPAKERQIEFDRSPGGLRVYVGDDVSSARLVARGEELIVSPASQLCDADIALVILDRPVDGVDPLDVRDRSAAKGDRVRAVGFGRGGDGASAGLKLYREHVRVLETTDAEFLVGEATCQGDSGGPALDEESGAVVGVVSRGGPSCEGKDVHNIYTRVDAFRSLVDEAIARADARHRTPPATAAGPRAKADAGAKKSPAKPKKPASDMGAACVIANDCAAGVCVTDRDRRYCSRSCGSGDRCPAGFRCKASTGASGSRVSTCLKH